MVDHAAIWFKKVTRSIFCIYPRSGGGRRLQRFGVVILLEILFEKELILHNFILSFLFVVQLLLQLSFIKPIKYIVLFLSVKG